MILWEEKMKRTPGITRIGCERKLEIRVNLHIYQIKKLSAIEQTLGISMTAEKG